MRKVISLILVIAMTAITTTISFGTENLPSKALTNGSKLNFKELVNDNAILSMEEETKIENETSILSRVGLDNEDLSKIKIDNAGNPKYYYDLKNVSTCIDVTEFGNGEVQFDIVEGNLQNTIVITPEGKLYLDGNLVKLSDINANKENDKTLSAFSRTSWNTTKCPYGSPSDYNVPYILEERHYIDIAQDIQDVAIGALSIIIGAINIFAGIAAGIAGTIRSIAMRHDVHSKYLSYSDVSWRHRKGLNVLGTLQVEKHITKWYYNRTCSNAGKGYATLETTYHCSEFM